MFEKSITDTPASPSARSTKSKKSNKSSKSNKSKKRNKSIKSNRNREISVKIENESQISEN